VINRQDIINNISRIRKTVASAADKSGRNAEDIRIMAVTKTLPFEVIEPAYEAGIRLFGENRVQEAFEKYPPKQDRTYQLHMIGHLQRNKANKSVDFFDLIQSVDSFRLAEHLNRYAQSRGKVYPVLLEINVGAETNKSGFSLDDIPLLADRFEQYSYIRTQGLMTVPPYFADPEKTRPYFVKLRNVFEKLTRIDLFRATFKYLSMGMSNDYHIAVSEGSNLIRIGTAIFGQRA
jgi:pyridoxal phosphate enzyme (YggS family)